MQKRSARDAAARALISTCVIGLLSACATSPTGPTDTANHPSRASSESSQASNVRRISFRTEDYKSWSDYFANRPSAHPTIDGVLTLPPGNGRVPAVVVMHGGTGITAAETNAVKHLVSAGFAAFLVDRGTGRGFYLGPTHPLRIHIASQLADGMNAINALAKQPRIDPAHIGILGYSLGGEVAEALESKVLLGPYASSRLRYAAQAGVYPVCLLTSHGAGTSTDTPTLLLVGGKDKVATAANCRAIVALRASTHTKSDVSIVEYPNARHGWSDRDIGSGAWNPRMPTLVNCPIVSVTASHNFFTYRHGELRPIDRDVYPPKVYRHCLGHGVEVGYSEQTARQSTAAWIAFFKKNLMH